MTTEAMRYTRCARVAALFQHAGCAVEITRDVSGRSTYAYPEWAECVFRALLTGGIRELRAIECVARLVGEPSNREDCTSRARRGDVAGLLGVLGIAR